MVDRPCSSDRACEILESGVGAGRIAISLAKPGFSVIDIDISKAMPEITNENFDRWEHSRGSFVFKEGYMATFDCRIAISVWSLSGETLFFTRQVTERVKAETTEATEAVAEAEAIAKTEKPKSKRKRDKKREPVAAWPES